MAVRLIISYVGTRYGGWQRQPNAPTVQAELERALGGLHGHPVRAVGASRTDAGVHARGQSVHLAAPRLLPPGALVHGVNHLLPPDIRVLAAERMADGFHARRWAVAKEYRYRLVRAPVVSALDAGFAVRAHPGLDLDRMRAATLLIEGRHDFGAFALAGGAHRQPVRRVFLARWRERGPELELTLVGDGFLRGMARGLVGTLLEVGVGRRSPESVAALLAGGRRGDAGPTAPAHGLCLERVLYPASTGALW